MLSNSVTTTALDKPDFIIIGAYKAGTTALYNYLNQHPKIYMTPVKETNYFVFKDEPPNYQGPGDELSPTKTLSITKIEDYRQQFTGVDEELVAGEASPLYLYDSRAASNIACDRPDAKIIAILRQPAERAYSNFVQFLREGRERPENFAKALAQEEQRIADHWDPLWHLKTKGLYAEQLKPYFDQFPREQIKIILHEDLRHRSQDIFQDLFQFLGVDAEFKPNTFIKHNQSRLPIDRPMVNLFRDSVIQGLKRSSLDKLKQAGESLDYVLTYKPQLDAKSRRELTQFYREDILKLQGLIGRDLSHWLA